MLKINTIEIILSAIFYDEALSSKDLRRINSCQLDNLYNYLYKQKILQLSYNYLKQLTSGKHSEAILLKTSEYIQKTNSRDRMLRDGLLFLSIHLTQHNIDHISLKGPLFSDTYYGESGKRVCGDIDLLISKKDVLRVKDILLNEGYDINQELFEKSLKHHYHFEAIKNQIIFEIHWNIDYGKNDYWDHLFNNSYYVQLYNNKIRVLNNAGQFLLFVVSISKDWFTRARVNKYMDLFQIVGCENLDYINIFKTIEHFGLNNRCYTVLFCLHYFCKRKTWPPIRASIFTKVFSWGFLTKRKVLMVKTSSKLTRRLGEKMLWKDTSFTSVPNIYKD